jgi:hypothetical protein
MIFSLIVQKSFSIFLRNRYVSGMEREASYACDDFGNFTEPASGLAWALVTRLLNRMTVPQTTHSAAAQARIQVKRLIPDNSVGTRAFRLAIRLACISTDTSKLFVLSYTHTMRIR